MSSVRSQLPKLLYIGDVPVEESFAGSTLLYRLLADYPADRLRILESNLQRPGNGRRLSGVAYEQFTYAGKRLLRTRLNKSYSALLAAAAARKAVRLRPFIDEFQPEAILTVSHGFSWIAAARLARNARLPLHLIIHDDWRATASVPAWYLPRMGRQFGNVYRQATQCYCISPSMRDAYYEEFGRDGTVLLPLRGDECPRYETPREQTSGPLTYAYAGGLHNRGYRELVLRLAALLPAEAKLLLFTPDAESIVPARLQNRIEIRAPQPPARLVETLRTEADILFCPSSFRSEEQGAVGLNFPSKLAEYTSIGLPILVWGPKESSPVKWERRYPGAALVATDSDDDEIGSIVERLKEPRIRQRHAQIALEAGERCFSPARIRNAFYTGLQVDWEYDRDPAMEVPAATGDRQNAVITS